MGKRVIEPRRIFCIGRNYREHVRELENETPAEPVVFMKPVACLARKGQTLRRPPYGEDLQHEAEAVVLIGKEGAAIDEAAASSYIAGISLGLDLTLRDVQKQLKAKGLPWELAKAFDQSAPIGQFIPFDDSIDLENISFKCFVNGRLRQEGNTKDMIFPIKTLIRFLSLRWRLMPGDLIYTGTPAGVGPLVSGNKITLESDLIGRFSWEMAGVAPGGI